MLGPQLVALFREASAQPAPYSQSLPFSLLPVHREVCSLLLIFVCLCDAQYAHLGPHNHGLNLLELWAKINHSLSAVSSRVAGQNGTKLSNKSSYWVQKLHVI